MAQNTNQSVQFYSQNNQNVFFFNINFHNNENKFLSLAYKTLSV